jgi:predicted mannosyl-3-phosphoglycerate phosphatase (HAD superfamily)
MNRIDIALDFDGTCVTHAYPKIGKDIGAFPVLKKLQDKGHRIFLWTMRSGKELKQAVDFVTENGINLAGANVNPSQKSWTSSPKLHCQLVIDDIALGIPLLMDHATNNPYVDWKRVEILLKQKGLI